jgi:beta-N-acetylglucosaminidase
MLTAIILLIAAAFIASKFIKSAQPKTFDQMIESKEPDCTEYADNIKSIKMVPSSKEPKIRSTISL